MLMLIGSVMFIAGLSYYAISKGRSGWWRTSGSCCVQAGSYLFALKDRSGNHSEGEGCTESLLSLSITLLPL